MDILPAEPFLVARLPLPPSVNALYKTVPWTTTDGVRTTRRVATQEYLTFQQEALYSLNQAQVDWEVVAHIRERKSKRWFLPLKLDAIYYVEHLWIGDTDNMVKALQDTIFGRFLLLNDTLVTDLSVKKRLATGEPYCKVSLSFAEIGGGEEW